MVRVGFGKKILLSLGAMAVMAGAVHASTVSLTSNNAYVVGDVSGLGVNGATATLTFSALNTSAQKTSFLVSETDTVSNTTVTKSFDPANSGSTDGFLTAFSATINLVNNAGAISVSSGNFNITVEDSLGNNIGSASSNDVSGGAFFLASGGNPAFFQATGDGTFSPNLGGVPIINFAFASPIPFTVVGGSNLKISLNGDGTAQFQVNAHIDGASNPTPLPAAAWGGLSLMGALGVGAMARRRRA